LTSSAINFISPYNVVRRYQEHGYDFIFITDHTMITDIASLNALCGGGGQFMVMPGEEVTSNSKSPELHVHANALNPNTKIEAKNRRWRT
jgi:predicted metal-dependent phosphoesterase TrpH